LGRPARPLISRERAARAALGVIDVNGLDALSLELVAQRMGVRAPSLYYHFRDKAELLSEIARLILMDVRAPEPKGKDWKQALVDLSIATRRSILQHPHAAPLLLQFFPRHLLLAAYDHWISISPLPAEMHMVMIEGLEKITLGSALFEASCRSRSIEPMPNFERAKLPHLADAIRANGLGDEALFVATMTAFLDGLAPRPISARPTAGSTARRRAKRKASDSGSDD
jgi:AcrR family transcriptional regulator